jgi:hypothetical protein
MTITWHVDDLKISHMDRELVGEVIEWFKSIYGNVRVSCEYHHDYLGMDVGTLPNGYTRTSLLPRIPSSKSRVPQGRQLPGLPNSHPFGAAPICVRMA